MTLMMSISGVRGLVGETLTPGVAVDFGTAFGAHVGGGTVVLGRDSRISGSMIESAVRSGLLASGCRVVDLGIVSTPGTALMVQELRAAGGIVITASHNPSEWNGLKFLTAQGGAPDAAEAERIFARYRDRVFELVGVDYLQGVERDHTTHDRHISRVVRHLDVEAIRRRQLKVVLDSVNGAGGAGGRQLLEHLGCRVEHINAPPTGRFNHAPEPTAENLTGLCDAVRRSGADLGFAQDPDADRLAIVDDRARYIGEEYTLALSALSVFRDRRGPVATNLSTSRLIDDIAATAGAGAVVHRTPVGEAHVAAAVRIHHCVLGGEGNGGVIDPRVVMVRDSFAAMGFVLNLLAADWRPLSTVVDELPRYTMIKEKYPASLARIRAWLERARAIGGNGRLNDVDGLRIDWPVGWVHLRPSNTEPIARVIAEAADEPTARRLAHQVSELL